MNAKVHGIPLKAISDLSRKAAEEIDMIDRGHARVRLELLADK
jgi:rare lipoprotein A (peptidoglycan hydrolase)